MDRRSSFNGRLSLSTSNLSSPIAESTQIGSIHHKFPWGGVHSPVKTIKNSVNQSRNQSDMMKKTALNNSFQKLDPRIYTDIQSKGLTSRIVKYYENSMKLNRSASFNSLYNKPGQFPVVHLKKNEISYKPTKNKNNVSIVRIAPPDKSVFQANSRSSILRSGSIVPTVSLGLKQNNNFARENCPILHPAVENETAPTRSVLEALKEISRKRINSDELGCNDTTKKYCKEQNSELSSNLTAPLAALKTHSLSPNNSIYAKNTSKRQRELNSSSTSPTAKIPNNRQFNFIVKPRRIHNEFTSSLSSSLSLLTPKRKYSEQSNSSKTSLSSNERSPNGQPRQKQKCDTDRRDNVDSRETYIDNIPASKNTTTNLIASVSSNEKSHKFGDIRSTKTEPAIRTISNLSESVDQKPKLTLFNKKYEVSDKSISKGAMIHNNIDDEIPKISFVKPRNHQTNNGISLTKNAMIEKTQKTKLALMLSGLRGDLNEDQDEVDSKDDLKSSPNNSENNEFKVVQAKPQFIVPNNNPTTITNNIKKVEEKNTKPGLPQADAKATFVSENIKQSESLKISDQKDKPISSISFELNKDVTKSAEVNSLTFGKNKNDSTNLLQNSQTPPLLNFSSPSSSTPIVSFKNNEIQNSIQGITKKPENTTSSMMSFINKSANTFSDKVVPEGMINENSSSIATANVKTTTETQPKGSDKLTIQPLIKTDSKDTLVKSTNSNSNISNVFGFNHPTTGGTYEKTGENNQIVQSSNSSKAGGFAFGNNSNSTENKLDMFKFLKPTEVQNPISPNSVSSNNTSVTLNSTFSFAELNKPSPNTNTANSFNPKATTFNFGNQPNSNMFTTTQSGQTSTAVSFNSPAAKPTVGGFAFGISTSNGNNQLQTSENVSTPNTNITSNGENNKSTTNQSPTFNSISSSNINAITSNNQNNNLFQFTNTNNNSSNQNTFSVKNPVNNSNDSVFGSNTFNPSPSQNTNSTFTFGGNSSTSTNNVFGGSNINTNNMTDAAKEKEKKINSVFGSSGGTSFLKSATSFGFNNTSSATNTNQNSNSTPVPAAPVFSFGNTNQMNNSQLNTDKKASTTFAFGGNNNLPANTFGNSEMTAKSNNFDSTATNSVANVFGNNITNTNSFGANNQNVTGNSFGSNVTNAFNVNSNTFSNNNNDSTNNTAGNIRSGQNENNKNNGLFAFGGSTNNTPNNSQNTNLFTFGTGNTAAPTPAAPSTSGVFNFNNANSNNNMFGVNSNNNATPANIFNPGPSNANGRQFRRATRRLTKPI